jgi:hypothetical protein
MATTPHDPNAIPVRVLTDALVRRHGTDEAVQRLPKFGTPRDRRCLARKPILESQESFAKVSCWRW